MQSQQVPTSKNRINSNEHSVRTTYPIIVAAVRLTKIAKIEPRFAPDNPAIAATSVDRIVVRIPLEFSGWLK